ARRLAVALLQEVKLLPSDEELQQSFLETGRKEQLSASSAGDRTANISEREINQHINQQKLAMLDRYPHELSGGQMQRVMIAMAISCNPKLLIADEPTTALDVTVQATILELLRELCHARGMSMMFITHDLGVIAEIADTVAVMYRGKIVESGPVWQIFSAPKHPYTKGLLACRPSLERNVRYLPTVSDFMEVVETPDGEWKIEEKTKGSNPQKRVSPTQFPATSPQSLVHTSDSPILSVKNLQVGFPVRGMFGKTKRYIMAVNGISFDVYKSETLGLVGESGCGKTTLARTLLRLIEPMGGQIFFEGRDITALSGAPLQKLRREMQIVFQNPFSSLDPRMKIGEAVMEPLQIHKIGKSDRERRDRAAYLLERVGLN
ncbi:MAG TPA: ATP-binding cassette domain-containing protein, partial [Phormidium sp.]